MAEGPHTVRARREDDAAGPLQSPPVTDGRVTAPLPHLILYGRPGCHLCDDAHVTLEALLAQRAETGLSVPVVVDRNIEDDKAWHRRYLVTIPVLTLGDRELELATTAARIGHFLAEALDGAEAP
jgi:hypothetical protein